MSSSTSSSGGRGAGTGQTLSSSSRRCASARCMLGETEEKQKREEGLVWGMRVEEEMRGLWRLPEEVRSFFWQRALGNPAGLSDDTFHAHLARLHSALHRRHRRAHACSPSRIAALEGGGSALWRASMLQGRDSWTLLRGGEDGKEDDPVREDGCPDGRRGSLGGVGEPVESDHL